MTMQQLLGKYFMFLFVCFNVTYAKAEISGYPFLRYKIESSKGWVIDTLIYQRIQCFSGMERALSLHLQDLGHW